MKNYPNGKSTRSSDEGDIVDLKSTIFLENFVMAGKLQCVRVKNLHALEVPDACKDLRRIEEVRDLVV